MADIGPWQASNDEFTISETISLTCHLEIKHIAVAYGFMQRSIHYYDYCDLVLEFFSRFLIWHFNVL